MEKLSLICDNNTNLTYRLLHSAVTVFPLLEYKGIGFAFLKSTRVILSNVTVPPAQN